MTQQQYAPVYPQAPQQPAPQGYPAPPQQYQPQYPQQPQQPFPGQAYGQQPYQQTPPPPPLAQGSLDDFYNQPSSASGPAISWSVNGQQKPIGTSYAGVVARDVTNADVLQDSDPKTGQPKVYRDQRPKWVMKVPLRVQPSPEFPEGEATWYVRGQARDELARAMTAAGAAQSPKEGDLVQITLVERRPSRGGGMPANIVQVAYQAANPGQSQAPAPQASVTEAASPVSVAPSQPAAPVPPPVAQPVQQYQQPYQPQYVQPGVPQAQVPQQPAQPPQAPAGLSPEQQALLAKLTGQQG